MGPKVRSGLDSDSEQDRQYFLEHPAEEYYLRPVSRAERIDAASKGKTIEPNAQMLIYKIDGNSRIRLLTDSQFPLDKVLSQARATKLDLEARLTAKNKKTRRRPKPKGFQ